jgi:hypothetical protein
VYIRLGLNEPLEPIVYKCKNLNVMLESIRRKYTTTVLSVSTIPNTTIDLLPSIVANVVTIKNVSSKANREVEVRLD